MDFLILKWVHILAAIVAFGANVTYFVWRSRAARSPEALPFTVRTIKVIEDRLANPAYAIAGISGLALVWTSGYTFTQAWVLVSIVLFLLMMVVGIVVYAPVFRRQLELAEAGRGQTDEYRAAARRGNILGAVLTVLVVAIVYLMTVRPGLWD